MPRGKKLSREDLIILVTQHLQRAGTRGLTLQELVDAIGPTRTSLATIRRVLDELRSDAYEAQITYSGKDRRWRLELPLAMPLQAPDPKDHLALVLAKTFVEPHLDAESNARLDKLDEELDARMRSRISPKDLPSRKAVTASTTLGTRMNTDVLLRLHAACRRKVVRILYESPWPDASDGATWQQIEPWALRMFDGAIYLCAWANDLRAPRKFRVAQIDAIEELAEQPDAASRQTPPADVWGDENPGIGIDDDRPGVAVIRFRGRVARWVERTVWHRDQKDVWIEPRQLLERTVAYRSCRELARRLASLLDGIESIQPAELRDEVVALVARAKFL